MTDQLLVTTTENIPNQKYEIIGEVFGVTTQSKNAIRDFGAGLKSIVGGEIRVEILQYLIIADFSKTKDVILICD